jgi:hypothetical protein
LKGGRQIKGGETAQPADKVVRLPRDWLGPREDLVPFGRRASAPISESSMSALAPDAPASAADFWGERSAAIHDAVQAPAEEPAPVVPAAPIGVEAHDRGRLAALRRHRRVLAATALIIAAATATSLMFGVHGPIGSASHDAGAARLNVAAVLNEVVSRTLQRGIALLDASTRRNQATATARHHSLTARRTAPSRRGFTPVHGPAQSQPAAPVTFAAPASADVARSTPPAPAHTYEPAVAPARVETSSAAAQGHASRSSGASVSPTGESGALGPVQSPNG